MEKSLPLATAIAPVEESTCSITLAIARVYAVGNPVRNVLDISTCTDSTSLLLQQTVCVLCGQQHTF